jgi:hypothetical protein
MWNDPIVEETRRLRDEYAAQFGYDLDALFRDLKEQERRSGREVVSFPPRKPEEGAPHAA